MNSSRSDAEQYITEAITGDPVGTIGPEFDVDGILYDLASAAGGWDFETIDLETFWTVVARHDATQAG